MFEKHLSAGQIEKMAGLKAYGVRNILLGRSKKPSAVTLKAIAAVLGCSIEELLSEGPIEHTEASQEKEKKMPGALSIENPALFVEATHLTFQLAEGTGKILSTEQAFKIVREAYVFALKKNLVAPDKDFIEWLMDQVVDHASL